MSVTADVMRHMCLGLTQGPLQSSSAHGVLLHTQDSTAEGCHLRLSAPHKGPSLPVERASVVWSDRHMWACVCGSPSPPPPQNKNPTNEQVHVGLCVAAHAAGRQ
jgi:hypothetical protein